MGWVTELFVDCSIRVVIHSLSYHFTMKRNLASCINYESSVRENNAHEIEFPFHLCSKTFIVIDATAEVGSCARTFNANQRSVYVDYVIRSRANEFPLISE